jgi:hypothetical protein
MGSVLFLDFWGRGVQAEHSWATPVRYVYYGITIVILRCLICQSGYLSEIQVAEQPKICTLTTRIETRHNNIKILALFEGTFKSPNSRLKWWGYSMPGNTRLVQEEFARHILLMRDAWAGATRDMHQWAIITVALVAAGLLNRAVERDPVNPSPRVATLNVCSAGRLVLPLQTDVSLLPRAASKYSM